MMMKTIPLFLSLLLIVGCSHTNNLSRNDLNGGTAMYRTLVSGDAASSSISVDNPTNHWAGDIAAMIGSAVLSSEASSKLDRAIRADSIAVALAAGMRQAVTDYTGLKTAAGAAENPTYIIEVELTEYSLVSGSTGISASVCGTARIIERAGGRLLWEDSEATTVPLSSTNYITTGREENTAQGATNAALLLDMEESEIRGFIGGAAGATGRLLGDQLREDLAELRLPD